MKTLIALIKREFWEHKRGFFKLPLLLGLLLIVLCIYPAVSELLEPGMHVKVSLQNANWQKDQHIFSYMGFFLSVPFIIILWIKVLHYFSVCLYDDRKDGSVLFWQSLPISQVQFIGAKLIMGLLVAPVLTLLCIMITHLLLMGFISLVIVLFTDLPFVLGGDFIAAPLVWFSLLKAMYMQAFFMLPLCAWCLFCSAQASSAPMLNAVMIALILVCIERFFLPVNLLSNFLYTQMNGALHMWNVQFSNLMLSLCNCSEAEYYRKHPLDVHNLTLLSQCISLLFSAAMIGLAARLRGRAYKFNY